MIKRKPDDDRADIHDHKNYKGAASASPADLRHLFFYYVGNIVLDISGISTKVSYDNTWRSHFCSLIGNINLNRRTKNTHKMGMGNFKESAGMLKNTL